jgi:hypothetical protein
MIRTYTTAHKILRSPLTKEGELLPVMQAFGYIEKVPLSRQETNRAMPMEKYRIVASNYCKEVVENILVLPCW